MQTVLHVSNVKNERVMLKGVIMPAGYWHSPVHEVHVHLVVVSVLLHLDRVRQDHVKVENQILDLEKNPGCKKTHLWRNKL